MSNWTELKVLNSFSRSCFYELYHKTFISYTSIALHSDRLLFLLAGPIAQAHPKLMSLLSCRVIFYRRTHILVSHSVKDLKTLQNDYLYMRTAYNRDQRLDSFAHCRTVSNQVLAVSFTLLLCCFSYFSALLCKCSHPRSTWTSSPNDLGLFSGRRQLPSVPPTYLF